MLPRCRFDLPVVDNSSSFDDSGAFRADTVPLYGLFVLWPAVICFIELVDVLEFCYRAYDEASRSSRRKSRYEVKESSDDVQQISKVERMRKLLALGQILMFGFNYLSNISALAFSTSVFAWSAPTILFLSTF